MVFDCANMIVQGHAAHQYHSNFENGQEDADRKLSNVMNFSRTVHEHLEYSVKLFYEQKFDVSKSKLSNWGGVVLGNTRFIKYGFIAHLVERMFYFFHQYLSIVRYLIIIYFKCNPQYSSDEEKERIRAILVDWYILFWILIEIVGMTIVSGYFGEISSTTGVVLIWIFCYRIFDIIQATVEVGLFQHLRTGKNKIETRSIIRSLIHNGVNFMELILCFGFIYSFGIKIGNLEEAKCWIDGYYFSAITQLTIGYGDIKPLGSARLLATIQGLIGFFFSLIIIGRVIGSLPKIEDKK